ncbi:MAG: hypothetical protein FWC41_09885, partial [Firmicutes bacterium]|nr:hypothetical protein [Bacillota bacterium]
MNSITKTITTNVIFIFAIFNVNLVSQNFVNDLFRLEKQILLEDLSNEPIPNSREITNGDWNNIQFFENDLYVMNLNKIENSKSTGRHFKLYIFSENENRILEVPVIKRNLLRDDYYESFAVSGKYLCILAQFNVYIYSIENNNVKFIRKVALDYFYNLIQLEGDKIIITMSGITAQTTVNGNHTNALIYDIAQNKTILKKSLSNPTGIEQSFFAPSNFITYHNGFFAVSDVTKYQIHIYDTALNLIQTLSHRSNNWRDIKDCEKCQEVMNTVDLKSPNVHSTISKLNSINPHISTVRRINFINDTTLFVCIENLEADYWDGEWYYDIWKKRNGKWEIDKSDFKVKGTLNTTILRFDCFGASYIISGGKLLTTAAIPFLIKNEEFSNPLAIKERMEDYF